MLEPLGRLDDDRFYRGLTAISLCKSINFCRRMNLVLDTWRQRSLTMD